MPDPIDANKIADLLDRYSASLELFAAQWTVSPEDCVQEAFMELARQATEPENCVAWLFQAVRRRAFNANRSRRRRTSHEQNAAKSWAKHIEDPSAELTVDDERKKLMKVLGQLPPESRELIVLRIWSGLTWSEIAKLTESSSSSAQRQYVNALEKMKLLLEAPCLTNPE